MELFVDVSISYFQNNRTKRVEMIVSIGESDKMNKMDF